MTQKRIVVVGAGSVTQALVKALVDYVGDEGGVECIDDVREEIVNRSRRRRISIVDMLDGLEDWCAEMIRPLADPEELKRLYLCCLMALKRELLSAHHRVLAKGVEIPLTLMAFILARDGPRRPALT